MLQYDKYCSCWWLGVAWIGVRIQTTAEKPAKILIYILIQTYFFLYLWIDLISAET